jgi:hypothetical protein
MASALNCRQSLQQQKECKLRMGKCCTRVEKEKESEKLGNNGLNILHVHEETIKNGKLLR